ncbi:hypothetical protein BKA70DRAFT_1040360, partial [Coprinopsis sp. MPI-PUGE-AT-0042]
PQWRKMSTLSRTFFESCSDNIWTEMSSLSPLLRLLPESALHDTVRSILMRPLNRDDFVRWRTYSRRVRQFKIGSCNGAYPSVQVMAMLIAFQAVTGEVLLPALQQLHCEEKLAAEELTCLSLLASPSVKALHLIGSKTDSASNPLQSALQHAAGAVPTLNMLSIQATNPPTSLWSILANFPTLHTLNLKLPNTTRHVEEFARFAPLKQGTLVLFAKKPKPLSFDPCDRKVRCSISIKRNRLLGTAVSLTGQLDTLISTASAAISHEVSFVEITCTEKPSLSKPWKNLVDLISVSSRSATYISLANSGAGGIIPLEALSQLMALDNLRILTVDVECHIQPTPGGPDQLFHHLCLAAKFKAMPLTKLSIRRLSGERLGLAALQHVCDHLPHLLELDISFDSSLPNSDLAQPAVTPLPKITQQHPLQRLYLRELRSDALKFKECRMIALLVNNLFPGLNVLLVDVLAEAEGKFFIKEGWELIDELRKDYQ